ncbi:unnamed protein product [Trichobilharzia regenti]|nr:unnamed protein product [Trichobilharzia regenti]
MLAGLSDTKYKQQAVVELRGVPGEDEEHTQQVFEEFVATFEEPSKSRAWVKGGIVNPSSGICSENVSIYMFTGSSEDSKGTSRIYRPVSRLDLKPKTEEQNVADKKSAEKPVCKNSSLTSFPACAWEKERPRTKEIQAGTI